MGRTLELPQWIEQRRQACRECLFAEVQDTPYGRGVTTMSRCMKNNVPLRTLLEQPHQRCPIGHFSAAKGRPGTLALHPRRHTIIGFNPRPPRSGGPVPLDRMRPLCPIRVAGLGDLAALLICWVTLGAAKVCSACAQRKNRLNIAGWIALEFWRRLRACDTGGALPDFDDVLGAWQRRTQRSRCTRSGGGRTPDRSAGAINDAPDAAVAGISDIGGTRRGGRGGRGAHLPAPPRARGIDAR